MSATETVFQFLHDHKGLPFRSMSVFNYVLEAALLGGILIALVLLARALFRKMLRGRVLCALWLLVAVRLLFPLAIPNPLMNELRPTLSTDGAARPVADQFRVRFQDATSDLAYALERDGEYYVTGTEYTPGQLMFDISKYTNYGWLGKWYLIAYAAGCVGVLGYMGVRNAVFRRRLRARWVDGLSARQQESYHTLCKELHSKAIPVRFAQGVGGSTLVGLFAPYIALPKGASDGELTWMLRHELTHYKRLDNWWNLLRDLCCALQWFNPLVWAAAYSSRGDQELACDEQAVAALAKDDKQAYASALATAAGKRNRPALCVIASGMVAKESAIKERMAAIERDDGIKRGGRMAVLIAAGVVTLCSFCVAESPNPYANVTLPYLAYPGEGGGPMVIVDRSTVQGYAADEMVNSLAFTREDVDAGSFDIAFDGNGLWYVLFTLDKQAASDGAAAYLDRWFPNVDSCTLVWYYSDYNSRVAYGRLGLWKPERAITGGLSQEEVRQLAREAVLSHYEMGEQTEFSYQLMGPISEDGLWIEKGHAPYWRVYLTETAVEGLPCRMVCVDAETGEVWLYLDEVSNG